MRKHEKMFDLTRKEKLVALAILAGIMGAIVALSYLLSFGANLALQYATYSNLGAHMTHDEWINLLNTRLW